MELEFKSSLQGLLGAVGPDLMMVTQGQLGAVSKQGDNQSTRTQAENMRAAAKGLGLAQIPPPVEKGEFHRTGDAREAPMARETQTAHFPA